jgi:hypothetical protein
VQQTDHLVHHVKPFGETQFAHFIAEIAVRPCNRSHVHVLAPDTLFQISRVAQFGLNVTAYTRAHVVLDGTGDFGRQHIIDKSIITQLNECDNNRIKLLLQQVRSPTLAGITHLVDTLTRVRVERTSQLVFDNTHKFFL